MKLWEIWTEGYAATGEHAPAQLLAYVEAENFKTACSVYAQRSLEDFSLYNPEHNTIWGCRLYDNETDARKSFG